MQTEELIAPSQLKVWINMLFWIKTPFWRSHTISPNSIPKNCLAKEYTLLLLKFISLFQVQNCDSLKLSSHEHSFTPTRFSFTLWKYHSSFFAFLVFVIIIKGANLPRNFSVDAICFHQHNTKLASKYRFEVENWNEKSNESQKRNQWPHYFGSY